MGVDASITLHPSARVGDVTTALGILAGLEPELHPLSSGALRVQVPGAVCDSYGSPAGGLVACARIDLTAPEGHLLVDGEEGHHVMYHFEWEKTEVHGARGLLPPSTPFWVAAGIKLVDFFGGHIDFNDCDTVAVDHVAPPSILPAADDQGWQDYQHALAAIEPVTRDDMLAVADRCGYPGLVPA